MLDDTLFEVTIEILMVAKGPQEQLADEAQIGAQMIRAASRSPVVTRVDY